MSCVSGQYKQRSQRSVVYVTIFLVFVSLLCSNHREATAATAAVNEKTDFIPIPVALPQMSSEASEKISNAQIENWALSFGGLLWETARVATKFDTIQKRFRSKGAKVIGVDGWKTIQTMASNVETMLQHKIDSIKRVMEYAENLAMGYEYDSDLGERLKEDPNGGGFHYLNAKRINILDSEADEEEVVGEDNKNIEMSRYLSANDRTRDDPKFRIGYSRLNLSPNKFFSGIPINTTVSSVHVPTNVFDGDLKVINAIRWSQGLDRVFRDNYRRDSTLSWQYFGSSTGFMRQYPATKWLTDDHDPDLYDARLRDWYVKSAASPKEIVILLDTSGSMTGLRKEIARHVVLNILETLGEDDFVTIYKFTKVPVPLVECFTVDGRAELVQATNENIRQFQDALNDIKTENIANFTSALTVAFELLKSVRYPNTGGVNCNQAIMLITDGVPYKFEDIFKNYNWPHKPVRVFTYLIGREIADLRAANWMACQNRGYFSHVTTLTEVKEQVLKYISVMARPMVMYRNKHPIQWTGVYADIEVPIQRPIWMIKLLKPSRRSVIFDKFNKRKNTFTGYKLMTSVSIPVFDRNNHTVRIAELLGVVGTDVPIKEIEKLTPGFLLGVNGYSFAVNNNGYILFHPDHRPMFQEILKPNYNSVDLAEVELIDSELGEPRGNDSELLAMRKFMVNQTGGMTKLRVKVHLDEMKRATIMEHDYFYQPLSNTPFTLGIVLPKFYGQHRVVGQINITKTKINVSEILSGSDWRIHPEWLYCQYNYANDPQVDEASAEDNLRHFLRKSQRRKWNWGVPVVRPLPRCLNTDDVYDPNCIKSSGVDILSRNSYTCNRELVESLVFDAIATKNFGKQTSGTSRDGQRNTISGYTSNETYKRFGIKLAFVATRSGLLRFSDHSDLFKVTSKNEEYPSSMHDETYYDEEEEDEDTYTDEEDETFIKEPHFADINNKAIDEVWYKRAVNYHMINPHAFVYSIPFNIGERKSKVTATHAIMMGKGNAKAPVAVAGMQIDYDIFRDMFFNETNKCINTRGEPCDNTCASPDIECYVVDNNGFIIISEQPQHTGKFFGLVDGTIFSGFLQLELFKPIVVYDYQAICLENETKESAGNVLISPWRFMKRSLNWIISQIAWMLIHFEIRSIWNPDWTYSFPHPNLEEPEEPIDYVNESDYEDAEDEANVDDQDDYNYYGDENDKISSTAEKDPLLDEFSIKDGGPIPLLQMTYINRTVPQPCDKKTTLYELNESKFFWKQGNKPYPVRGRLTSCRNQDTSCERPFSVQLIQHTNLIMILADNLCPCFSMKVSIEPTKIEYGLANETEFCHKLKHNAYRRSPTHCLGYHAEESEIKLCGGTWSMSKLSCMIIFVQQLFLFLSSKFNNSK